MLRLYLLHPPDSILAGIHSWMSAGENVLNKDQCWNGVTIHPFEYQRDDNFSASAVAKMVMQSPGPVVLIEPVNSLSRGLLQKRLLPWNVAIHREVKSPTNFLETVSEAKFMAATGERFFPRKLIFGLLMIHQLNRLGAWSRDGKFVDPPTLICGGLGSGALEGAQEVLHLLFQTHHVVREGHPGKRTYSLNDARQSEIYEILNWGTFSDETTNQRLMADKRCYPVRILKSESINFLGSNAPAPLVRKPPDPTIPFRMNRCRLCPR